MTREERQNRPPYFALLILMLVLFVLPPFLPERLKSGVSIDIVFSSILLSGVWRISRKPLLLVVGAALAGPAILARWTTHLSSAPWVSAAALACATAFFAFIAVVILVEVLRQETVTTDTILGAVCVYLLMALTWGLLYTLVERVDPNSFAHSAGDEPLALMTQRAVVPELIYYSIVTLTTVGFGDIRPVTHQAQALTGLEALAGQLYLAVLIARLVGLHAKE